MFKLVLSSLLLCVAYSQTLHDHDVVKNLRRSLDDNVLEEDSKDLNWEEELIGNATWAYHQRKLRMRTSDLRFNKFSGDPRGFKPLKSHNYPVYGTVYDILYDTTDAMDVMMVTDDKVKDCDVPRIIEKLGGLPSHPDEGSRSEFWDVSISIPCSGNIDSRNNLAFLV